MCIKSQMRSLLAVGGLALAALFSTTGMSSAAVSAMSVTSPTVWSNTDNQDHSLGWSFHVSSPVTVTALGYNDYGFSSAHNVGIYSSGATLLASAVVTGGSTLDSGYRYTSIASLLLGIGDYFIVGTTLGYGDGWIYEGTVATIGAISYTGSYYTSGTGGTLAFPSTFASTREYMLVNFQVASGVPEPATWAMMLIGFAGLAFAARRRAAAR